MMRRDRYSSVTNALRGTGERAQGLGFVVGVRGSALRRLLESIYHRHQAA